MGITSSIRSWWQDALTWWATIGVTAPSRTPAVVVHSPCGVIVEGSTATWREWCISDTIVLITNHVTSAVGARITVTLAHFQRIISSGVGVDWIPVEVDLGSSRSNQKGESNEGLVSEDHGGEMRLMQQKKGLGQIVFVRMFLSSMEIEIVS